MSANLDLSCRCGATRLHLSGAPMLSVECCCTSCRTAGGRLMSLPGAARIVDAKGTTPYVLYRKDRVQIVSGAETLREARLKPSSKSRRVVATCCNTPLFLDFQQGHWLSLYASLWPAGAAPPAQMRTMTKDLPDRSVLPEDMPNPKTHTFKFFRVLMGAWIAMGFKVPKVGPMEPLELPTAGSLAT